MLLIGSHDLFVVKTFNWNKPFLLFKIAIRINNFLVVENAKKCE